MTISKKQEAETITFGLAGRLDTNTSPQFQDMLIPAFDEAKEIKLDFSQIVYVSSAGLRVLLVGEKTAKAKGVSMVVTGVQKDVMEVFEMTGFDGILTIE